MLVHAAFAAFRQVLSRPFRKMLWRSIALTIALLALVWFGLTRLLSYFLKAHPLSTDYPILDTLAFFAAGAGLFIAMAYLLPAVSALVAGYFLDDAAEVVERIDFPDEPPGRALPMGKALLYGLRFAGLSLLVNLVALMLFFIPVVNLGAFFAANAYLLGREYFELAALRSRSPEEAGRLRVQFRSTVLLAGAIMAGLVLVPVLNLLTPLFGIAMMVHLHKRLSRRSLPGGRAGGPGRVVSGPGAH
jgi:CysZ protein